MVRYHILKKQLSILGYLFLLLFTGCSNEYSTVGPALEAGSKISGGSMLLLAGMPGGAGTSDGKGVFARFNSPRSIVASGDTLYIADQSNHAIRKIGISTGTVTTLAGYPGKSGFDDGIGTNARFNAPEGIETDGTYLYISDTKNNTIRKVEISTGNVVTLAGKRGQSGAKDGSGKDALFKGPTALILLGDYLYVADTDNSIIRQVNKDNGGTITVAGNSNKKGSDDGIGLSATFNFPLGIATDGKYLYIADTYNHTIRRLDPGAGEVITLAGKAGEATYKDGSLTDARFNYPYGLVIKDDELFVADLLNEVIRVIGLSSGTVNTIAGTPLAAGSTDGLTGIGSFNSPGDLAVTGDYMYVADMNNDTIRRVDIITGEISTIAGKARSPGAADAIGDKSRFSTPGGVVIDGDALYVADTYNHTIRKVDIASGEVTTLAGTPGVSGTADSSESPAVFNSPTDVIADETGENIYIIDTGNHVVRRMNLSTGEVRTFVGYPASPGSQDGVGRAARLSSPKRGIRLGDKLYIADTGNHVIRQVDIPTGTVTTLAGNSGTAGWTDTGEGSKGIAMFNSPGDITTDGVSLYVADTGNHAIRKVDLSTGVVETVAGTRGSSGLVESEDGAPLFNSPEGIVWYNGILYVSDTGNHIIRKVDLATKDVSFLAGDVSCTLESQTVTGSTTTTKKCTGQATGTSAFGDSTDGTGKTTSFNGPTGIKTDGTYLYVMNTSGNTVRRVDMSTGETKTFSYSKDKGISLSSPSGGGISGNILYVADRGNQIIRKLDITGLSSTPLIMIAGSVGTSGYGYSAGYSAEFNSPIGITADGAGNLYIADTGNHTIRKIVIATKEVTTVTGVPGSAGFMNSQFGYPMFNSPHGICIVGEHLYVADSGNHLIRRVSLSDGYVGLVAGLTDFVKNVGSPGTADSTGAAAGFNDPRGITSDGTYLYVTDTGNHSIRRILRTTGQVKTIAGMPGKADYKDGVGFDARFSYPRGITLDGDYLYVADTGNNVLRRVNKNTGEVLTFSGKTGQASFASGGRDEARYNNVVSLTTTPDTPYLFFTDSNENVVGKVEK